MNIRQINNLIEVQTASHHIPPPLSACADLVVYGEQGTVLTITSLHPIKLEDDSLVWVLMISGGPPRKKKGTVDPTNKAVEQKGNNDTRTNKPAEQARSRPSTPRSAAKHTRLR
jgi:hypothetical protein